MEGYLKEPPDEGLPNEEKEIKEKIKKGHLRIEVKSRKGDPNRLYLVGIVPTELAADIVKLIIERKN